MRRSARTRRSPRELGERVSDGFPRKRAVPAPPLRLPSCASAASRQSPAWLAAAAARGRGRGVAERQRRGLGDGEPAWAATRRRRSRRPLASRRRASAGGRSPRRVRRRRRLDRRSPARRRQLRPGKRERRIERSASLTLAAPGDELDRVAERVQAVTDRYGGFVLRSSITSGDEGAEGGNFELRIPANRLQPALRDLAALGEVRSRTQSGQDVTPRVRHCRRPPSGRPRRAQEPADPARERHHRHRGGGPAPEARPERE